MKRCNYKILSYLLIIVLFVTSFAIDLSSFSLAAGTYIRTDYSNWRIVHSAADYSNGQIDARIDIITAEHTAIMSTDAAGTRGLNPFVYDRNNSKDVYGCPYGEFANSDNGTMIHLTTRQRGEYKYLGHNFEGKPVTNDRFIRPTAGGWLSTIADYKNLSWQTIDGAPDTWRTINNSIIADYLLSTNFKDSDYTGTPAGNPGISLNYIFNSSLSEIQSKAQVLLPPTVWYLKPGELLR